MSESDLFRQSERGRIHVGLRGNISDVVKTDYVLFSERRVVHSLTDPLSEVDQSLVSCWLVSEAIDMDQGQLNLFSDSPHLRVTLIKQAHKNIQELDRIHRQIHKTVIKAQPCFLNPLLHRTHILPIHQHLHKCPRIHIKSLNTLIHFIERNVSS